MLKRIKQATSCKKGESYIYVCVLVLFISALVSVVILYMGLMAQVQIQKRDVEMKLDSCVADFATEAFDSIKQGDNYEFQLDLDKLKENAYKHLGFGVYDTSITYDNESTGNQNAFRQWLWSYSDLYRVVSHCVGR